MEVRVRVTPGGRRERVTKLSETELQVVVREPAERNAANSRVREIVAETFGVLPRSVHIRTGHKSHTKVYTIGDVHT